jgi:hypothetical protein
MEKTMPDGVWPTMVTPFTDADKVDYGALGELVEWYIDAGVDGLFAVCQSSEMFFLSLEERVSIAEFVVKKAAGRVPVIASGHLLLNRMKGMISGKRPLRDFWMHFLKVFRWVYMNAPIHTNGLFHLSF